MRKLIVFDLFGVILDPSARKMLSKLSWMSLKQTNVKFDLSYDEFLRIEKRIKPIISAKGDEYWDKFFRHVLIEIDVSPTPKKVEIIYDKLRNLYINSCKVYPDFDFFINNIIEDYELYLVSLNKKDTVLKVLQKKDYHKKVEQIYLNDCVGKDLNFFDKAYESLKVGLNDKVFLLSVQPSIDIVSKKSGFFPLLLKRKSYENEQKGFEKKYSENFLNLKQAVNFFNNLSFEKEDSTFASDD